MIGRGVEDYEIQALAHPTVPGPLYPVADLGPRPSAGDLYYRCFRLCLPRHPYSRSVLGTKCGEKHGLRFMD